MYYIYIYIYICIIICIWYIYIYIYRQLVYISEEKSSKPCLSTRWYHWWYGGWVSENVAKKLKMWKTNILSSTLVRRIRINFYVYINENKWPIGSNWYLSASFSLCLTLMLHSSHCHAPRFDGFGHQALRIDVVHNGLSEMLPGTLDKSRKNK